MKNEHLVPVNIQDIAERVSEKYMSQNKIRMNEYQNYILRLEAIRDYCEAVIAKAEAKNSTQNKMNRR